ncbi:MAG: enoyl-CoA hydratase/isomerase [Gammaproteobacteria bacterium]|nr:enoyl-CoA hydratase/isomerase [Gammaproteobacteria bacterium]DAC82018.1 TPA_exp: enoyl-CoA hydratase (ECH) [uncultured Gammaproteobacteria bacterium]
MTFHCIDVKRDGAICFIRFNRPEKENSINDRLIDEVRQVLAIHTGPEATNGEPATVVVLEGSSTVFCSGADFHEVNDGDGKEARMQMDTLYGVWQQLSGGPFISVAHVKGKANAGGLGFVCACDLVLADETASFGLSELLFGLFPACVFPFLVKRIGFQRAHYLTLTTKPISSRDGEKWGLVDRCDANSDRLLLLHLSRLRLLPVNGIKRYKAYVENYQGRLAALKPVALEANEEMFDDPYNRQRIRAYVETGQLPWESV